MANCPPFLFSFPHAPIAQAGLSEGVGRRNRLLIAPQREMQVLAGGPAGTSLVANHFANRHLVPRSHVDRCQMAILRHQRIRVLYVYFVSAAVLNICSLENFIPTNAGAACIAKLPTHCRVVKGVIFHWQLISFLKSNMGVLGVICCKSYLIHHTISRLCMPLSALQVSCY